MDSATGAIFDALGWVGVGDSPWAIALLLALAGWVLYAMLKWVGGRIRTAIAGLRRDRHALASLVRDAKWRAVDVVVSDIAALEGLRISIDTNARLHRRRGFVRDQIGAGPGSRQGARDSNVRSSAAVQSPLARVTATGGARPKPRVWRAEARLAFTEVDRHLLDGIELLLGRDVTVAGKIGELAADQVLQEIWDGEFADPSGKGNKSQWEDLPPQENGMRLFLDGFRDPQRGWRANFRAIMNSRLSDPEAKAPAEQLQTILGVDILSLVTGVDERCRRIEARTNPPPLPLHNLPRHADTVAEAYVPFTFEQRNTDLAGRESELAALHQFLDSDAVFSWWQKG